MNAYDQLLAQARERRDKAISAARTEYLDRVGEINALFRSLGVTPRRPSKPAKRGPIIELICDLIPQDRLFTFREIVGQLREAEPGRRFHEPTLRTFFQKLRDRGMIRRVSRGDDGCVFWAAAGFDADGGPFGAKSLPDVAEVVLRDSGPMPAVELVLMIQERGYRTEADPRTLYVSLTSTLKRNPRRFQMDGDGRWGLV